MGFLSLLSSSTWHKTTIGNFKLELQGVLSFTGRDTPAADG